nr:hypothetical protein CFP56_76432 [Quercus suber]
MAGMIPDLHGTMALGAQQLQQQSDSKRNVNIDCGHQGILIHGNIEQGLQSTGRERRGDQNEVLKTSC